MSSVRDDESFYDVSCGGWGVLDLVVKSSRDIDWTARRSVSSDTEFVKQIYKSINCPGCFHLMGKDCRSQLDGRSQETHRQIIKR